MVDALTLTAFQRLVLHTLNGQVGWKQGALRRFLRKPDQARQDIDNVLTDALFALRAIGAATHVNRFWTITDEGRGLLDEIETAHSANE